MNTMEKPKITTKALSSNVVIITDMYMMLYMYLGLQLLLSVRLSRDAPQIRALSRKGDNKKRKMNWFYNQWFY